MASLALNKASDNFLNFYNFNLFNFKESYNFASETFYYNDVLDKENYFAVKKYIKGLIESQFHEREFIDNEFLCRFMCIYF